jgi:hypothetical protein
MCKTTGKAPIYDREDLKAFNLLTQPIWVFDIERKAIWWANKAALELWNAETLDSLLSRNFADAMSEATERRLADYMEKFKKQETVTAQVSISYVLWQGTHIRQTICAHVSFCYSGPTIRGEEAQRMLM